MAHTNNDNGNGRVGQLLWINTILTALLLPLVGFVGVRLWDRADMNMERIHETQRDVTVIKDRQDRMLSDVSDVKISGEEMRRSLDEHIRMTGVYRSQDNDFRTNHLNKGSN